MKEGLLMSKVETIKERLAAVRETMAKTGVDIYLVLTNDYHISEYSGDYFKEREFITGFTGSAGTAVILKNEAKLFTDGRYYVQAAKEIEGTGFELMKDGSAGVPTLSQYVASKLEEGMCLAFDGRTVDARLGFKLADIVKAKKATLNLSFDAIADIFTDRAAFPESKAFYLDEKYCGTTISEKLEMVREILKKVNADSNIIASLDDVCWLFNIRGNDVWCNPVIMSYAYVSLDKAILYTDGDRFNEEILAKFKEANVEIRPYEAVYTDAANISGRLIVDPKRVNMRLYNICMDNENLNCLLLENPTVLLKSIKNETEIKNLKDVHLEDGAALTKFIFWTKKQVKEGKQITEADAAEYLDSLRAKISDYIELSFDTISATGPNGAMMHYHATKDNAAILKPEGMLLVDSGGQYLRGTTDVTRTFALGPVTDEMKKCFTLTLKGMLNLANARFLHGCNGFSLDILARGPLWDEGIDYRCGTGHGVGYLLNVHESPNGFRWRHIPGVNDLAVLEPGMVTSDEPGVYEEGKFGIRIENEIVCKKDYENEYGTFLSFDMLTMAPIDLELVDPKYLEAVDIKRLNAYHEEVYNNLKDFFTGEELEELKAATKAI